jgi:hypothetical protein
MGAIGQTGPQGIMGPAGPPGEAGAPGVSLGADAATAIPVSCLSPCHGFNGVVTQYQSSTHYQVYLANVDTTTAAEWTTPGLPCGNCHAIDALEQRVSGNVGTNGDGGVANLASGELQYFDSVAHKANYATYAGTASVAQVYCTTCHAVTSANDPHVTGVPWTPGSFPLAVSPDAGGAVFLEKSPTAGTIAGSDAGSYGPGDTCMWCHRSRVDVTNYIGASNKITSAFWGPHEGPQADVFTGHGGYEYAGQSYGTSTHQQKLSCVDCHMPNVTANSGVPNHSFNPQLTACAGCHTPAPVSFDVGGGQSVVEGAMTDLERALNQQGWLTRTTTAPYTSLTDPDGGTGQVGDGNWANDEPMPGAVLTADQAGALYNYLLVARGGAFGVHNPLYEEQLLYDSYAAVVGQAPPSFPVGRPPQQ